MGLSITMRAESPSLTALLVLWCTSCSGKRQSRAETSAPPKICLVGAAETAAPPEICKVTFFI